MTRMAHLQVLLMHMDTRQKLNLDQPELRHLYLDELFCLNIPSSLLSPRSKNSTQRFEDLEHFPQS